MTYAHHRIFHQIIIKVNLNILDYPEVDQFLIFLIGQN